MLANKTLQLKLHRHHQVANNISPIPPSGVTIPRHSTFLAHRAEATNHGISSASSAAASSPDVDGLDLDNHGPLTHAELSSLYGAENACLLNHLGADDDDEDDCILDPVSAAEYTPQVRLRIA